MNPLRDETKRFINPHQVYVVKEIRRNQNQLIGSDERKIIQGKAAPSFSMEGTAFFAILCLS
jgi:hypothetical protein